MTASALKAKSFDTAPKTAARKRARWASSRTYISAALIFIWCLLPFYWMIVTAFRDVGYTFDPTPFFTHVTMDNFATVFSTNLGNHFAQNLLNSLIIGGVTTVVALLVGILAAYALSRLEFRFKFLVLGFVLGA